MPRWLPGMRAGCLLLALWLSAAALANTHEADDARFAAAYRALLASPGASVDRRGLEAHPLVAYLDQARLGQDVTRQPAAAVRSFLDAHTPSLLAERLRRQYHAEFWRRGDHESLLAIHLEAEASPEERCRALAIRLRSEGAPRLREALLAWYQHAGIEWKACKPLTEALRHQGALTPAMVRARIDRALTEKGYASAAALAVDLPAAQRALLERRLQLLQAPNAAFQAALRWPDDTGHRAILVEALAGIARRTPEAAVARLAVLEKRFAFTDAERRRLGAEISRGYLIDDDARGLRWLEKLPSGAIDGNLREWQARWHLRRSAMAPALEALLALPEAERDKPRWAYAQGRLHELLGQPALARQAYALAAGDAGFHGFLAADRIGAGYAICPEPFEPSTEALAGVRALPAIHRALSLWRLGFEAEGKREWLWQLPRLSPDERRLAGLLAADLGRGEIAILSLNQPADWRLYEARYPLLHTEALTRESSSHGLDPAFAAGLIRAESAWNPTARSSANAIGLMQLLPGTAAIEAKALGMSFQPAMLSDPLANLKLGSHHLARLLDRFEGSLVKATAAYNAGAGAVRRWGWDIHDLAPELWAETIPFRETRDYVPRVLGYSVIYDWRMGRPLRRLSDRLKPGTTPAMAPLDCPSVTSLSRR